MIGVKEDGRSLTERLRRADLWKVADYYNLSYPPNASAEVLRPIIDAAGVDVTKPIQWMQVQMPSEDGKTFHQELYPVEREHATANKDIDYDAEIEKRAKRERSPEELKQLIAELNDELKLKVSFTQDPKEVELESLKSELQAAELKDMQIGKLKKMAKEKGITVPRTAKKAEIIEMINGKDSP